MLSVSAIYDGNKLTFLDKINIKKPSKVIVTFLENPDDDPSPEEMHFYSMDSGSLDFLNEKEEDIYTDTDLKIKY